ncbi:MAG: TonB family protein [Leisingera sp.]
MKNRWGAAIISRVERQKRPPRGGGTGTVRLRITVSAQGRLVAVSVTQSSGNTAVDQAAMRAVRKARLPRAPKALAPGDYSFTLRAVFTG